MVKKWEIIEREYNRGGGDSGTPVIVMYEN